MHLNKEFAIIVDGDNTQLLSMYMDSVAKELGVDIILFRDSMRYWSFWMKSMSFVPLLSSGHKETALHLALLKAKSMIRDMNLKDKWRK